MHVILSQPQSHHRHRPPPQPTHIPKQIYLKDDQLGPNGGPPTPEAALALVESKEGSGGGSGGRGGRGRREAAPKKEKATRAPSAFLLFTKERRPALTAGLPFAEQQKALSDAWKVRVRLYNPLRTYVSVHTIHHLTEHPPIMQSIN